MTADLPALLQRAAQAMPGGRIRIQRRAYYGAGMMESLHLIFNGREQSAIMLPDLDFYGLLMLEAACREEIEARGWTWATKSGEGAGRYTARVYIGVKGHADVRHGYALTPAHALLAALLSAVEESA